ncbi:MAG: BrnA antitoxin family protein [Betaproteobacteria bacterium]
MNANKTSIGSDLGKLDAHVIAPEEYEEIPELTRADFDRPDIAWRIGGNAVREADGRAVFSAALRKQKINITLDPDVVAWFKQQAGGRGYQTLINATLREAMQKKTIEETLRRVIREELHPA